MAAPAKIMGLSAFYHDSAAALVHGDIVAAAQEERFSRVRHDDRLPRHAIAYCLREGGLREGDLDYVAFYDKPLLKFDRLLETYLAYAPRGLSSFLTSMPSWLKTKLHHPREITRALGKDFRGHLVFTRHHESHAASAFFPSPFAEAAVLTLDGVGEWDTASISVGRGNRLELRQTLHFPHSLGLLYSAVTYFTGFKVNSGEYKVMGLAPYGEPRYADLLLDRVVDLKADGSFAMDMEYFNFCQGLTMTSPAFDRLIGGPRRDPESALTQRDMDLAASVQAVTEEIVLRMARHARALTGQRRLCLAGGVALNCVANGKLLRSGLFEDVWVQPAAGDAGGALGAALFTHHQLLGHERIPAAQDAMRGALLGPRHDDAEIGAFLAARQAPARRIDDEGVLLAEVARAIAGGAVVGWFSGRMEYGPRALGARSILADPRDPEMQSKLNLRIKQRESFRPFAPCVLREHAAEWFELDHDSPYMLFVAPVRPDRLTLLSPEQLARQRDPDLRKRINVPRSTIPAVTHVDGSARVQTVDAARHGRFHRLLEEFHRQTGCPLLINTSFNIRGEPVVCTPEEAYRCFLATDLDVLVLGNHLLTKAGQPTLTESERRRHAASFQPD
jgi:carbamoyltransferase